MFRWVLLTLLGVAGLGNAEPIRREPGLEMYSRGIPDDLRERIAAILRSGQRIRDIEFQGEGVIVLYGANEYLAYKVNPRIGAALARMKRDQPLGLIRRVRTAGNASFVIIGAKQWYGEGLDDAFSRKLRALSSANEFVSDVALFGPHEYVVVRDRNGYLADGVPARWLESLEQVRRNGWQVTQLAAGSGDDGQPALIGLLDNSGYLHSNAPRDLHDLWREFERRGTYIRSFGMRGSAWVVITLEKNREVEAAIRRYCPNRVVATRQDEDLCVGYATLPLGILVPNRPR